MSLTAKILSFPVNCSSVPPRDIVDRTLRNRTFYKAEELDAPTEFGITYGEWKKRVALDYLSWKFEIPSDLLFLLAMREDLERGFLTEVERRHGRRQRKFYEAIFTDIHSSRY